MLSMSTLLAHPCLHINGFLGGNRGDDLPAQQPFGHAVLGPYAPASALALDQANHALSVRQRSAGGALWSARSTPIVGNLASSRQANSRRNRPSSGLARRGNDRLDSLPGLRPVRRPVGLSRQPGKTNQPLVHHAPSVLDSDAGTTGLSSLPYRSFGAELACCPR